MSLKAESWVTKDDGFLLSFDSCNLPSDKDFASFSEWLEAVLEVKFQQKSQILKVSYKSEDKKLIINSLNLISKK